MNQLNWTYLDDMGNQHQVGVAHGEESGNLLIYVNAEIVKIDFKVFEPKSYTFFIEQELCAIHLDKNESGFLYSFKIDKKVDTPLNRMRKKTEKKHLFQSFAYLGVLAFIVFFTTFGMTMWNSQDKVNLKAHLVSKGQETTGRIYINPEGHSKFVSHNFIVQGRTYSSKKNIKNKKPIMSGNGMPLEEGDEFLVKYMPNNPNLHEIYFNKPTDTQVDIYKSRVIARLRDWHPEYDYQYCTCLANTVLEIKGTKGLADLYFQKTPSVENAKHNTSSFQSLMNGPSIKAALEKNCGK